MSLARRISETLRTGREARDTTESFRQLEEYLNLMKSRGLVRPETYTLPPLDTLGSQQTSKGDLAARVDGAERGRQ